jgi:hypothetical protein
MPKLVLLSCKDRPNQPPSEHAAGNGTPTRTLCCVCCMSNYVVSKTNSSTHFVAQCYGRSLKTLKKRGGPIPYSLTHLLPYLLTHALTRSTRSRTHSLTHPPTHPLTHSPTHPLTHSPTHPLTHSPIHPSTHPGDAAAGHAGPVHPVPRSRRQQQQQNRRVGC